MQKKILATFIFQTKHYNTVMIRLTGFVKLVGFVLQTRCPEDIIQEPEMYTFDY